MRTPIQLLVAAFVGLMLTLPMVQADSALFPDTMQVGPDALVLNGAGTRKKLFISVYRAGLYLKQKSNDAHAILAADEPMAIRLIITSSLVTPEKMTKATREGFRKSTGGNTAPIAADIEKMIGVFRQGIEDGDVFDMIYQPQTGTRFYRNDQEKGSVAGAAFKKALFGIWISNDPVQKNLKKAMLGG
ncbi:MAG: chalcone isomerase [Gammaproteobacteria bacterium]|nr:MAG: chalcone isomerase [Gammaproteobacteria bacterium]